MTNSRRTSRFSSQYLRSASKAGSWFTGLGSCVLVSLAGNVQALYAQGAGVRPSLSPAAPSSAVGAITNVATVSLMGIAALPASEDNTATTREQLFMGVTQPVGRLGGFRFTAIGLGYWHVRDGISANTSAEGALALRATGRINGMRTWTAIAYGRANALAGMGNVAFAPMVNSGLGFDGTRTDTTVSRRVDVGSLARVESGILGSRHGIDVSLGVSVERATRVTTQTISIQTIDNFPSTPTSAGDPTVITRTLRAMQRREVAAGLASVGFQTGGTSWLGSLSAPIYAWITRDAAFPAPRLSPAIASLAVTQPITAWLSAVGSASTNATNVGSSAVGDDALNRRTINPVFALGVSVKRAPNRNRPNDNNLSGILGFESRVIQMIDSVIILADSSHELDADGAFLVQFMIDAPTAAYVELMGDATSWSVTNMNRGGDGRWRATLKLAPGSHRFTVRADGGDWIAPPGLPLGSNEFGGPVGLFVLEPQSARK